MIEIPDNPDPETALQIAVRNKIQAFLDVDDTICQIETEDMAPSTIGQLYIVVFPGGVTPGPDHDKSGTVIDELFGVNVTVHMRVRGTPRDRRRDVMLSTTASLNYVVEKVKRCIDFQWSVMDIANDLMDLSVDQGFEECIRWVGQDTMPREINPDYVAGNGTQVEGLARTIHFGKARRLRTRIEN